MTGRRPHRTFSAPPESEQRQDAERVTVAFLVAGAALEQGKQVGGKLPGDRDHHCAGDGRDGGELRVRADERGCRGDGRVRPGRSRCTPLSATAAL